MTIFISIVGLGLLVFVHELGPLHGVRGPADAPAEVLHRLPAGARQAHPQRDRVRHRHDPARRLREDPRACTGRRRPTSTPSSAGRSRRRRRSPARPTACAARSTRATTMPPGPHSPRSRRSPASISSRSRRSRGRQGRHRHRRRARPGCVLARPHVEARARDLRRAGREHHLRVHPLHRPVHDLRRQGDDDRRQRPREDRRGGARAPVRRQDRLDQRYGDEVGKHDLRARSAPRRGSRSRSSSSGKGTRSRSGRGRRRRSTGPIASASSSGARASAAGSRARRRAASPASCRRAS